MNWLSLIFSVALAGECEHVLELQEQIAMYERMKDQASRIAHEESVYAAAEYIEELNRRIEAIRQTIGAMQ